MTKSGAAAALLLGLAPAGVCQAQAPTLALSLGPHRLQAEVASTPAELTRGLMQRRALPADRGMLFVFPQANRQCMWMKDTLIPLSVAFLDEQGRILNITEMAPRSTQTHCSAGAAGYALEMNAGWFTKNGGRAGQKISGLDKAPRPE